MNKHTNKQTNKQNLEWTDNKESLESDRKWSAGIHSFLTRWDTKISYASLGYWGFLCTPILKEKKKLLYLN